MLETGIRMLKLRHILEVDEQGLFRANPKEQMLLEYYANSITHIVAKVCRVATQRQGAAPTGRAVRQQS